MKLRLVYTFKFRGKAAEGLAADFEFTLGPGLIRCVGLAEDRSQATVHVEIPVDAKALRVAEPHEVLGGDSLEGGIDVPERELGYAIATSAARLLSFVVGQQINASSQLGKDELVPETHYDRGKLAELGNRPVDVRLSASVDVYGIHFDSVGNGHLALLAEREVGIALYLDATSSHNPVSRFRDLWRVLESGFAAKGRNLLGLLERYPPAQRLGFDRTELKELHVWRGRASHAESSAGLGEYNAVAAETSSRSARLRTLANVVLITKAEWANRSLEAKPIAKLRAYHKKDGQLTILQTPANLA